MHENVTHNRDYKTFNEFRREIIKFLWYTVPRRWKRFRDQISDNFRVIHRPEAANADAAGSPGRPPSLLSAGRRGWPTRRCRSQKSGRVLEGYLPKKAIPDSATLLPPPPAVASAAAALDQEIARGNLALRDTDRWRLAVMDANLKFPEAAGAFSCALGAPVTEKDTPRLCQMLRRVMTDAGFATFAAKDKYRHARPFMLDGQPICTPDKEQDLRAQGSHPSGHTSIG